MHFWVEKNNIMWIIILHDGADFGRRSRHLISFVDCDDHISFSLARTDSFSSWMPLTKIISNGYINYPDMASPLSICFLRAWYVCMWYWYYLQVLNPCTDHAGINLLLSYIYNTVIIQLHLNSLLIDII